MSRANGPSWGELRPLLLGAIITAGGEAVMKLKCVDRRNFQAPDDHGCESGQQHAAIICRAIPPGTPSQA